MHKIFWTFCTFLIILTIISAFGGSIRFRENFLEEIFDVSHTNEQSVSEVSNEILTHTFVSQEAQDVISLPSVPSPVVPSVPSPVVPSVPSVPSTPPGTSSTLASVIPPRSSSSSKTNTVIPSRTNFFKNTNSYGPVIEAFDGEQFASFR
jgi:hypothetical protein